MDELQDGEVAAPIVAQLVNGGLQVHQAIARHASTSSAGVTVHTCDFSRDSLKAILWTVKPNLAISTTIGHSFELQRPIIDAVVESATPCFMPAEFGDDVLNGGVVARLPKLKPRKQIIEYPQKLSSADRISWVAIATGCLLDGGLRTGRLGFDLDWHSATLHGKGTERFAASSSAFIGRVVLAVIQQWSVFRHQYIYAAGQITSANEVLRALEVETSKQWEAGRGDVIDCVREAERRIERGFPDAGMFLMERSVLYDDSLGAVRPFLEQDAKTKLGLQAESIEDVVRSSVHQHSHHGKAGCGCD